MAVPSLVICDFIQPTSPLQTLAAGVEVCYDARGDVLAYCIATNAALRVDLPDFASFYLRYGADQVTAIAHRALTFDVLLRTYQHCVLPLILPAIGTDVLHASGVVGAKGVAAFCGPSGIGKSTVAVGLARRGNVLWADDAVAVDTSQAPPISLPLPFAVRLRPDSAGLFRAANGDRSYAPIPQPGLKATPLALLCALRQVDDADTAVTMERLDGAAACKAALSNAYCFSVKNPEAKRRIVESYLTLTASVPVYEIRFRPRFEDLPILLDVIEDLIL